jgi:hypothetical protein
MVYMKQPLVFEDSKQPGWVCQLDLLLCVKIKQSQQRNTALHTFKALIELELTKFKLKPSSVLQDPQQETYWYTHNPH